MTLQRCIRAFCMAVLVLSGMSAALAAEAPPSDASIRELVAMTSAQRTMGDLRAQLDASVQNALKLALKDTKVSPEQRKILDDMANQMVTLFEANMKWQDVDAISADICKRTLNQREVDGMIAFYKTEAGQAVINKMPVIAQNTAEALQGMIAKLLPEIRKLQEETLVKLQAAEGK